MIYCGALGFSLLQDEIDLMDLNDRQFISCLHFVFMPRYCWVKDAVNYAKRQTEHSRIFNWSQQTAMTIVNEAY